VLETALDTHAAAAAYVARWPRHPPDFFTDCRRAAGRRAFESGDGWACRLLSCLETPAHFTLHAQHLDLPREAAAPHLLFDRANVRRWKAAILTAFKGPCRWRLELGDEGRVHAHVLADAAELPELPRGGRVVSPCLHYWETAVRYVLKPPLIYKAEHPALSAAHLALWLEAKKRGRLPTLAGSRGIPNRRTWGRPSKLRVLFPNQPEKATPSDPATSAAAPVLSREKSLKKARRQQPTKRKGNLSCRHRRARGPPLDLDATTPQPAPFDLERNQS
jgi:hypothetical protein